MLLPDVGVRRNITQPVRKATYDLQSRSRIKTDVANVSQRGLKTSG
jgi:hypothetical protein